MASMAIMPQAWVNPQALATRAAPSGWSGTWPPVAPPGFRQPPPVPPGFDSTRWHAGQWQFNPNWRGAVPAQPTQMWAPHPSWGITEQPQYIVGPSGRLIKQPNKEYWQTQLVDNPLGLENMHIRYVRPFTLKGVIQSSP